MDIMTAKIMLLTVMGLIIIGALYGEFRPRRKSTRGPRGGRRDVWHRDGEQHTDEIEFEELLR